MQWFLDNKEWLFSGIGVFVLSLIVAFVVARQRSARQSKQPWTATQTNHAYGRPTRVVGHSIASRANS